MPTERQIREFRRAIDLQEAARFFRGFGRTLEMAIIAGNKIEEMRTHGRLPRQWQAPRFDGLDRFIATGKRDD